jgi:hypothetical protein
LCAFDAGGFVMTDDYTAMAERRMRELDRLRAAAIKSGEGMPKEFWFAVPTEYYPDGLVLEVLYRIDDLVFWTDGTHTNEKYLQDPTRFQRWGNQMCEPKNDYENPLRGASMEILHAMSSLNMQPEKLPHPIDDSGYLTAVDKWASHAHAHLQAAYLQCQHVNKEVTALRQMVHNLVAELAIKVKPVIETEIYEDLDRRTTEMFEKCCVILS